MTANANRTPATRRNIKAWLVKRADTLLEHWIDDDERTPGGCIITASTELIAQIGMAGTVVSCEREISEKAARSYRRMWGCCVNGHWIDTPAIEGRRAILGDLRGIFKGYRPQEPWPQWRAGAQR